MKTDISFHEADFSPICPHCRTPINDIAVVVWDHVPFRTIMFACPGCQKLLGVARTSGHGHGSEG